MISRRYIEILKDYDCPISSRLGKANVVVYTGCRKCTSFLANLMVKQRRSLEKNYDLHILRIVRDSMILIASIQVLSDLIR